VWNSTTGGNYWQDWLTPDADSDGIVDDPYRLDGSLFGIGGGMDHLPLTGGPVIPEFVTVVPVVGAVALIVLVTGISRSRGRRND